MIHSIVGYCDGYGKIHYKIVHAGDELNLHAHFWPNAKFGKWRYYPDNPKHLNTYNEEIEDDLLFKIWDVIDKVMTNLE